MAAEIAAQVRCCVVMPMPGKRTIHDVRLRGVLIGRVRTGSCGQVFRLPDQDEWSYSANHWNSADPEHGHAIAALLAAHQEV